jgi:hypothetical protein
MSRRQAERGSRFRIEIEDRVRRAGVEFRDNDLDASVEAAVRLWWTSRLRGRRFLQLVQQAREVTQARISLGRIERGKPGQRDAMPYFFAVLRQLVEQDGRAARSRSEQVGRDQANGVLIEDAGLN